jgi:hypothetical protein
MAFAPFLLRCVDDLPPSLLAIIHCTGYTTIPVLWSNHYPIPCYMTYCGEGHV